MEQPINDDDQSRSAQVLYRGVEERFEAVQDEVSLLKAEIQQTLIDLREFMMKGHAISSSSVFDSAQAQPSNGLNPEEEGQARLSPQVSPAGPPAAQPDPGPDPALRYSATAPPNAPGDPQGRYAMDAVKMGHIIGWLGTVTSRGLSPKHLKPFLQSYEQSGHLTSTMAQLTYKSLEDLDGAQGGQPNRSFSPTEYAECLLELHEIICNPGYAPDKTPAPRTTREAPPMQQPVSAPGPVDEVTAPQAQDADPLGEQGPNG